MLCGEWTDAIYVQMPSPAQLKPFPPSSGSWICRNLASEACRAQTSSLRSILDHTPSATRLAPQAPFSKPFLPPGLGMGWGWDSGLLKEQTGRVGKGVGLKLDVVSGLHM